MSAPFLVIEGLDGAGTTTQTERLRARLAALGHRAHVTREPSVGPIGALIRQVLTGRLHLPPAATLGSDIPWDTLALLFAADRLDHVAAEIEPALTRGEIVLSDRYDASSVGYQSASCSAADRAQVIRWIVTLNQRARRPDLVFVLTLSAEQAKARRAARGLADELYERDALQQHLAHFYAELPQHMPEDRVLMVDGAGSIEQVHQRIWQRLGEHFPALCSEAAQ